MNIDKTKEKLSKLTDTELDALYNMVLKEKNSRMTYMSNTTHTPREQCQSLTEMFGNAWIH